MWLLQTNDPFKTSAGGFSTSDVDITNFANKVQDAVKEALKPDQIATFFNSLESAAVKLNTTVGLGLAQNVKTFEKTIFEVYKQGLEFGIAWEDSGKFLDKVGTAMGRLVPINAQTTQDAIIFGKTIGATPEVVGELISNMTAYGVTQSKSVEIMNKVAATAKASGLNASKLTSAVSKDLYKTQIYGFRNGVDGLTKMAAQAQRVGFSLEKAQTTANKILDGGPEKAIEMASELQALGGNIGSLGDPFQLIHMAQYDMEGLQDQIINASASAVQFNETTGDFKISGEEMLRLRKQADILGLSYEDVAKGAINMRKEQEIASRITFPSTITEEQKNLVASLAEIGPNGSVKIDLPGFEGGVKDLQTAMNSPDFMDALNKYGEDLKISNDPAQLQTAMYTNAQTQLSTQEKMVLTLEKIQAQGAFGMGLARGQEIRKAGEDMTMYGAASPNYDKMFTEFQTQFTAYGKTIKSGFETLSTSFQVYLDAVTNTIKQAVINLNQAALALKTNNLPAVSDAFIPAGGNSMVKTGFGQILPNTADEMLFSPDISDFFAKYNESEKRLQEIGMPKGGDLSMMYKSANASPNTAITDLMSKMSNISSGPSEIKQTVEIGGKTEVTLNINTNIPQNLISQVLDASQLKETIMNTVNTRLSAEFSDKLSNALITQKRG
jgi:hypothetical protein